MISSLLLPFMLTGRLTAQLDTVHWLAPMYSGAVTGTQYIYLYTPEINPFPVTIEDGSGLQLANVSISATQPYIYELSDTYSQLLTPDVRVNKVLNNAGLIIHGAGKFYASFRLISESGTEACYITCKGRTALGRVFRTGNIVQGRDKSGQRFNFVSVMATEDNTNIRFSDYDPSVALGGAGQVPPPMTAQLQRGECIVFTHYVGAIGDDQPVNAFMGALLESTRPVTVNCGAWLGAPVVYAANDIGTDQALPLEQTGKEYIFCRGNGPTTLEHPIIVAHTDNTKLWINGSDTVSMTLDAGDFFSVPAFYYLPAGNIFVRSSAPVFAYQMIGGYDTGKTSLNTVSLLSIPPLSCGIPHRIENIRLPNQIGSRRFDGALLIIALKDAQVSVQFDGQPVDIGPAQAVAGNSDFVTYRLTKAFSRTAAVQSMSIISDGAVYATVVGRYEYASYASFLMGYDYIRPQVNLTLQGNGICPDTLTAHGVFDGLHWVYYDTTLQEGPDTVFTVLAPGLYKATAYLGGCRMTSTVTDSLDVPLNAPAFDFSYVEPSCYGYPDGEIAFGQPNGGLPPYQYSIDHGQHLYDDPVIENVKGGNYKLIVRDASGCYNEPVTFALHQPDSVYVQLSARRLPRPLRPGDLVILEGFTSVTLAGLNWSPPDSTGCTDCLLYRFHPQADTWVRLTVYDKGGCPGTDSLLIEVEPPVYAPNVIHPASPYGNERFLLYSREPFPVHRLVIFNRWGGLVFEKKNFFTNDSSFGWDGTRQGQALPAGTFTFFAEVEVAPGRTVAIQGDITVIR